MARARGAGDTSSQGQRPPLVPMTLEGASHGEWAGRGQGGSLGIIPEDVESGSRGQSHASGPALAAGNGLTGRQVAGHSGPPWGVCRGQGAAPHLPPDDKATAPGWQPFSLVSPASFFRVGSRTREVPAPWDRLCVSSSDYMFGWRSGLGPHLGVRPPSQGQCLCHQSRVSGISSLSPVLLWSRCMASLEPLGRRGGSSQGTTQAERLSHGPQSSPHPRRTV